METSSPKFHTLCETLRSHLGSWDTRRIVVFSEFQQLGSYQKLTPNSASRRGCTSCRTDADGSYVHDGVRPMLAQDYGVQLVKVQFSPILLRAHPNLTQAKEAVEHGKFNVIVTTQLPSF
jgi:hypothetical protein